jgi:hypothetical protein
MTKRVGGNVQGLSDEEAQDLVWCLQETFTPQIACESGVPRLEGTPSWRHYTSATRHKVSAAQ